MANCNRTSAGDSGPSLDPDTEQVEVGPGSYSPDVSITKHKACTMPKYLPPRSLRTGPVDQIYKYIREIKELQRAQKATGTASSSRHKPPSQASGGSTASEWCCFRSRSKKCEPAPDPGIPGPGTYASADSMGAAGRGKFGTEKRALAIINQNNTIIIRTRETELPGVGQYFPSPLRRDLSPSAGGRCPSKAKHREKDG